jgi:hypothetical protein
MLIWGAIFFGPPLVLALAVPMYYADANEKVGGTGKVNMMWSGILLLVSLIFWSGLLNFIYLPAMGFSLGNPALFDFGNLQALRVLWLTVLAWVGGSTPTALALLACPLVAVAVIMLLARYLGLTSREKEMRRNYYSVSGGGWSIFR